MSAAALTPEDLRPIVKIDAEKIIAAIAAAGTPPSPVYSARSADDTVDVGGSEWTTLAAVTVDKLGGVGTGILISASMCAANGEVAAAGQMRVLVNGTPRSGWYAFLDLPDPFRFGAVALPGLVADHVPGGAVLVELQWTGAGLLIAPADRDFTGYALSAQEVTLPAP